MEMDHLKIILGIIGIIFIFILAFYWESFKYDECIKVGHSKTYCVLNIGSK